MNLNDLIHGTQTRDFHARAAVSDEGHTLTAIGVPYETEIDLGWGYREKFAPGAVRDDGAILRYGHKHPIGKITESRDTEHGREIVATISTTPTGDEVRTLIRDGVLDRMSIGFEGISHSITERDDGTTLITWTDVIAREYSVVEFPAYPTAEIQSLRNTEGKTPMTITTPTVDTATADLITDLQRDVASMRQTITELADNHTTTPSADTRSIGAIVRSAAVDNDAATIAMLNDLATRDYSGTVLAADPKADVPTAMKDLARIIDNANPLMGHFQRGALPPKGNSLEFVRLKTNTITVDVQANEGDDLVTGKLDLETDIIKIKTYGGYVQLSRKAIDRSPLNVLNRHLHGMAIAAGAAIADAFSTFFEAQVKAREESGMTLRKTIAALEWADLNALIIDASQAYSDLALPLTGLIVNPATFKALTAKTDKNGRPLFIVHGTGANSIGEVNLHQDGINADLAGLKVIPNFRATASGMGDKVGGTFFNASALCAYTNPLAHLQDANIINLTQAWSVYQYAAFADEIPAALVPVTHA